MKLVRLRLRIIQQVTHSISVLLSIYQKSFNHLDFSYQNLKILPELPLSITLSHNISILTYSWTYIIQKKIMFRTAKLINFFKKIKSIWNPLRNRWTLKILTIMMTKKKWTQVTQAVQLWMKAKLKSLKWMIKKVLTKNISNNIVEVHNKNLHHSSQMNF